MVLETIRREYPELTQSQRRLSDFVARSYREAAFMTASELADHLGLNEATVIRFAQRLGYGGYPELVSAIRELVQQELLVTPGEGDGHANPVLSLLSAELENAQRLVGALSPALVQQVTELLSGASSIYVLGQGLSYPYALLFCNALRSMGWRAVSSIADLQSLATALCEIEAGDVIIGLSAGDERDDLVAGALRAARRISVRTLAIGCDLLSPCAQAAELALICPRSGEFLLAPITAMAVMIDVLVQTMGARHPERVRERLERTARTRAAILSSAQDQ